MENMIYALIPLAPFIVGGLFIWTKHQQKMIEKQSEMTAEKAEQLIEQGIITDGMIVKVNAALDAARTLGRPVDIASWRHAEQLPALFNGTPIGTRILA